ncbi:branched-chain amino acid ABC transporter permease [Nocardioides sp. Y6]|uniref:Branched-chain amino acid ABC transporter permease n=1 Tax=Nocardioides malaquae TaxID=2773426 RepID=A0ABR9RT95_9ACTN|nr:branched-chain amino acid ABC transporter permease [Nocardioides malaquae]MBE7324753.1 branched-chain amino acid ABC transporter permease [Nocardioides malaquae]
MAEFLQLLISGLSQGALYGLIALGFVIVFKATGILNFSHGAVLLLGAYVVTRLAHVNFLLALVAGVAAAVALNLLVERVLVRSMAGRSALAITVMTIGLDVVLMTFARGEINTQIRTVGDPWGSQMVSLGAVDIPLSRLVALVVSLVVVALFFVWFKRSSWGVAFRAATERRDVAPLMGIRLNRLSVVAWLLAGVLAVIAGVFLATFPSAGVNVDLAAVALRAFPAAVIGGLDSTHGAIVGGLLIGTAEMFAQGYQAQLEFLGAGFHEVLTYVLMVAVLWFRPAGLFGTQEVNRV